MPPFGNDPHADRHAKRPPGVPWGLGLCAAENPAKMAANTVLSPNSFGSGGTFSTQSWAGPLKKLIWGVMYERDGKGDPDNSEVRIAFHEAARRDSPK